MHSTLLNEMVGIHVRVCVIHKALDSRPLLMINQLEAFFCHFAFLTT